MFDWILISKSSYDYAAWFMHVPCVYSWVETIASISELCYFFSAYAARVEINCRLFFLMPEVVGRKRLEN